MDDWTPTNAPQAQPQAQPQSTPGGTPATTGQAAPPATGTHSTEDQRGLAAVAYILTWITGLIIYLVANENQRYAKWHAIQAIGLGVVAFAVSIVLSILSGLLSLGPGGFGIAALIGLLQMLVGIGVIVLIIVGAIKAYKGEAFRLPVLADFADKQMK